MKWTLIHEHRYLIQSSETERGMYHSKSTHNLDSKSLSSLSISEEWLTARIQKYLEMAFLQWFFNNVAVVKMRCPVIERLFLGSWDSRLFENCEWNDMKLTSLKSHFIISTFGQKSSWLDCRGWVHVKSCMTDDDKSWHSHVKLGIGRDSISHLFRIA
jgi:hypothetical protein